ncbi:protein of unknown function [Cupriavidus taiwanensis]|nr:protein of unknown function [Cupriavidus taiwanensis]
MPTLTGRRGDARGPTVRLGVADAPLDPAKGAWGRQGGFAFARPRKSLRATAPKIFWGIRHGPWGLTRRSRTAPTGGRVSR